MKCGAVLKPDGGAGPDAPGPARPQVEDKRHYNRYEREQAPDRRHSCAATHGERAPENTTA